MSVSLASIVSFRIDTFSFPSPSLPSQLLSWEDEPEKILEDENDELYSNSIRMSALDLVHVRGGESVCVVRVWGGGERVCV